MPTPRTAQPIAARTSEQRARITPDDVIDAALKMVEADGPAALTMRKLAAELDVTTNTLYWHVGTRDDISIALIKRLADNAGATVTGSVPLDRVVSAIKNIWMYALDHRNVTALANQIGATTLLLMPLEREVLAELEVANIRGTQARDVLRSVMMCVAGFLVGAWRSDQTARPELHGSTLWAAVTDDRIDATTLQSMSAPVEIEPLFESTIRAILEPYLSPTDERERA